MLLGVWLSLAVGAPVVTSSTTRTATLAASATTAVGLSPLDALPLSPEDLALIESLGAETPTVAASAPDDGRFLDSSPRSILDLERGPALAELREDGVGLASPILRGRSGRFLELRMDGVELDHPLASAYELPLARLVDPFLLAEAGWVGSRFELMTPRFGPNDVFVEAGGRSADRALEVHGGGSIWAKEGPFPSGIAGRGGYVRSSDQRTPGLDPASTAADRFSLSGRAGVYGAWNDPLRVYLGFDAGGVVWRTKQERAPKSAFEQLFVALDLELEAIELELRVFGRLFDSDLVAAENDAVVGADLTARVPIGRSVRLGVSADFASGTATIGGADGTSLAGRGALFAELATRPIEARLEAGLRGRDDAWNGRRAEALRFVGEASLILRIFDPLRFSLAARRSAYLPSIGDLARSKAIEAEDSTTIEGGPRFVLDPVDVSVVGFWSGLERPIDRASDGSLVNRDEGTLAGLELRAGVELGSHLAVDAAAGFVTGEADGAPLAGVVGLVAAGRVRVRFPERGILVEASVRGADPLDRFSAYELAAFEDTIRARMRYVRADLRGAIDLGAGFRLELRLGNLFDAPISTYGSALPEPGFDLSLGLGWSIDRLTSGT